MLLQYCEHCKQYTLKEKCDKCGNGTRSAHPARFSPQDPNSEPRIAIKRKHGLLPQQKPDMKF